MPAATVVLNHPLSPSPPQPSPTPTRPSTPTATRKRGVRLGRNRPKYAAAICVRHRVIVRFCSIDDDDGEVERLQRFVDIHEVSRKGFRQLICVLTDDVAVSGAGGDGADCRDAGLHPGLRNVTSAGEGRNAGGACQAFCSCQQTF